MSTKNYLLNLIKDRSIASVTPSSRFAVERVCKTIDFSTVRLIVEYGPGLGVFTKYLLNRISPEAKIIAFELNQEFCATLQREITDPRLTVINVSAERALEFVAASSDAPADHVISGIPFSMLPPAVKDEIIRNTAKLLSPQGSFLTYQVFPPPVSLDKHLRTFLEPYFTIERVEYEFRNVPPLRIYESKKKHVTG